MSIIFHFRTYIKGPTEAILRFTFHVFSTVTIPPHYTYVMDEVKHQPKLNSNGNQHSSTDLLGGACTCQAHGY